MRQRTRTMGPQETAERALAACRSDGCAVIVTEESEANVRWANSALTTDGITTDRQVTVVATAARPGGVGVGVVSHRGRDGVPDDLVRAAGEAARASEPAEDAAPPVSGGVGPAWGEPVPRTSMAALADLVTALGEGFQEARARGHLLFGYARHRARSTLVATSGGARLRTDDSTGHIELTGRSVDRRRSAWAGSAGDLGASAVRRLCAQVDQRLGWAHRQVDLPAGRYETLLPPAAVADLMNYVYYAAGAREAVEGRSVYSAPGGGTRLGERLSAAPLTLRGDPYAPGLECAPFLVTAGSDDLVSVFDNGLALPPTAWIDDGVLSALIQTRHSAALTGMPLTPHVDNLVLTGAGATASLEDLVAGTDRGLLLTTLWYIREVDLSTMLLTGLTRDGVYLVDGGEVVGAVTNFRFNDSPVDMLGRVREVGATEPTRAREWGGAFTHCAMPPLRVADFHLSSVSRAV